MTYTAVLSESLHIFWKHKSIWLFGILLTICGQGSYGFNVRYNESTRFQAGQALPPGFSEAFTNTLSKFVQLLAVGLALGALWWVVSNLVGALARAALTGMAHQAGTELDTSLRHGWRVGVSRFWPLFLISLLLGLPQLVALLLAIYGFLTFIQSIMTFPQSKVPPGTVPVIVISICALCCIGGLTGLVLYLIKQLAVRACVLEPLTAGRSLLRGWQLLRRNLGYTLLNALLLGVLSNIYGIMMSIPALALWIPVARAILHQNWTATTILLGGMFGLYYLFFSILVGGILTSFNETVWTRLYLEFVRQEAGVAQEAGVQARGVG